MSPVCSTSGCSCAPTCSTNSSQSSGGITAAAGSAWQRPWGGLKVPGAVHCAARSLWDLCMVCVEILE
jgi:hypothetical protein